MEPFMTLAAALSGRARIRRSALLAPAVAVACFGAAGAAQADGPGPDQPAIVATGASRVVVDNVQAVGVLIGANYYGFTDTSRAELRSREPIAGVSPRYAYVRGP